MGAGCCPSDEPAPRRAPRGTISAEEKKREKATMKITKYLRFNVPNKTHKINKEEMDCFNGEDALKTLMDSKFFVKDGDQTPRSEREVGKFYTKEDCLNFWRMLIAQRAAIRGVKMYKEPKSENKAVENKKKEEEAKNTEDGDKTDGDKQVDEKKEKKKRLKFKVGMH